MVKRIKYIIILLSIGVILSSCSALGKNTEPEVSMFKGNAQHSGIYNTTGPDKQGSVKWKFNTGDKIRSTPTVYENIIYIGNSSGSMYSLDAETGVLNWEFTTDSPVSSTAAVSGNAAYFVNDNGILYSINTESGRLIWQYKPEFSDGLIPRDIWDYYFSSPAISKGMIYYGSRNGMFYVINQSGKLVWEYDTLPGSNQKTRKNLNYLTINSPAIYNNTVYFGAITRKLYALDAKTGKEKWIYQTDACPQGSPCIDNGTVYFGGRDAMIHALDADTGEEKWNLKSKNGSWFLSTPVVYNGTLYTGSSDDYGLYAIDAGTGSLKWIFSAKDRMQSSPVVANGIVYCGSDDGNLYAIDAQSGELQWKFDTGYPIYSSPVVHNGIIYIGSDNGYLYALE